MIFSAILMIAFSGVSRANDIAEKEVVYEETVAVKQEAAIAEMDCNKVQQDTIKEAKSRGMSDKDATSAGYQMWFWCKGENVKNMQFNVKQF